MRLAITFRRVDPSKGGAETYVADLCRGLLGLGHSVDLYAQEWAAGAIPKGVQCVRLPVDGWGRAGRIRAFAESAELALRRVGPAYDCTIGLINTWHQDVLIPQGGTHDASLEANAGRRRGGAGQALYRLGKRLSPLHALYRQIERRQYHPTTGARRVVAVSRFVADHLARHHHLGDDRVRIIPNAIDASRLQVEDVSATRLATRHALGLNGPDVAALFVAHNFRLKGLPALLNALAERRRAAPGARPIQLIVCGKGAIPPMRALAERLGVNDLVRWVGFAPDVRPYYHAADFFILPTYYDPCSLVVFEALTCGLPVITTRSNGAGEVLTEGREGFVVASPDDVAGTLAAFEALMDDDRRRAMAREAALLGQAQTFDRHVGRLVEVFHEVADEKRHVSRAPRPMATVA